MNKDFLNELETSKNNKFSQSELFQIININELKKLDDSSVNVVLIKISVNKIILNEINKENFEKLYSNNLNFMVKIWDELYRILDELFNI